MAEQPYDPAARRQRYLETRELKGREKGSDDPVGTGRAPAKAAPPANRQAARAAAAQRVSALNAKLTQLKAALAAARQKSSSSKPSAKPGTAEAKSKDKAYNEKYYEEHKSKIAADKKQSGGSAASKTSTTQPATRSVEELESAIRDTLNQLKVAVARLKSL